MLGVVPAFGGGEFTLPTGCLIWRLISSSLGMPGVGVAPRFSGLPASPGSGIPGIGPFGVIFACPGGGMPGVEFADGASGLVENSGGKELASKLTMTFPFVLALEFAELTSPAEPQPMPKLIATIDGKSNFFINVNITCVV